MPALKSLRSADIASSAATSVSREEAALFARSGCKVHFVRWRRYERHPEMEAPTLGEHNDAVLREYLGYSAEQIAALEREGVLHRGER
jgi:crotonobetainyl-CoA:carnitine CoA-transferase CaiB-like acyl-CoA transferase